MFYAEILWEGIWQRIWRPYRSRDDAEWAIAVWRQENGANGKDTGFRVVRVEL